MQQAAFSLDLGGKGFAAPTVSMGQLQLHRVVKMKPLEPNAGMNTHVPVRSGPPQGGSKTVRPLRVPIACSEPAHVDCTSSLQHRRAHRTPRPLARAPSVLSQAPVVLPPIAQA